MEKFKLTSSVLAVVVILIVQCKADEPTFTATGSKVIRQGYDYKFTASAQSLQKNLIIDFKLYGNDESGKHNEFNLVKKEIRSNELHNFVFYTKSLNPGKYNFSVNVYEPCNDRSFYEVQELIFEKRQFSIFIQTDKPIYKAGDLMRFRAFSLDSETRPFNVDSAVVTILDPNNVKIKTFTNVTFVKGKYENSLQLSNEPTLGDWRIKVEADVLNYEKTFGVEDYVLPTYSITIDVPQQASIADKIFPVKITADYTFGQSVKGVAVVTFTQRRFWWFRIGNNLGALQLFQRTVNINSESVTFDVDIIKDLKIENTFAETIDIDVEFTEELTRKTVQAQASILIVQNSYSVVFTGDPSFIANTTYNLKVSLRDFNGRSAPAGTNVTVDISLNNYCFNDFLSNTFTCPNKNYQQSFLLDSTGSVDLKIETLNYDYIQITTTSLISNSNSFFVSKPFDPTQNVLVASVLTKTPQIGSKVIVKVTTSLATLETCFCQTISKGILLDAKRVTFKNQIGHYKFQPDFSYAPTTQLICYFYNSDGLISSTQTSISFVDILPNYLNLELSSNTVEPGANLSLKVSSSVSSTVSLLAIDQSVLLLKDGNDLSKDEIFNDLMKYNNIDNNFWWTTPIDEQQFEMINLFVLKINPDQSKNHSTPSTLPLPIRRPVFEEQKVPNVAAPTAAQVAQAPSAPRIRKNFVETLLWEDIEITDDYGYENKQRGSKNVEFTAPDSITSFVISGVSISEKRGLGLPRIKPVLKVFLPFFIQANLPNHIKRGEVLLQDIIIFNYLSQNQNVVVSVKRNDQQFVVLDPAFDGWTVSADQYLQNFTSVPNQPKGLRIVIQPKVLGFIDISIEAIGALAGDSISKPLRVNPEGIKKSVTQSVLIMKNETHSTFTASLTCVVPTTAIKDTTTASAAIIGDLLGDMLNNLENLIQMSYGCGEQNMLNFVPNIVALIYLGATGQLTDPLKAKAIGFAEDGYQRELNYRRTDGSFSAFGNSDINGSTWLTGYVVKSFLMARSYIFIDEDVIKQGIAFFISKQNGDGSYREDGEVIHKDMQGGSSGGLAMTAYLSIVLSDNIDEFPEFRKSRDDALNYVALNVDENDVYALSISSLALYKGNHSNFTRVYDKFLEKRIETADQLRWAKPVENKQDQDTWWWESQPRSNDVELTAYGLELILNFDLPKAVKITRYLVTQRNTFGGFGSSQDTVVGIKALSDFSVKFHAVQGTLNIHLTPDLGDFFNAQVNSGNILALQIIEMNPLARQLNIISGDGSFGSAVVSLTCNFYELSDDPSPRFIIKQTFIRPCKEVLKSQVCLSYIPRAGDDSSNMVLMKMTLPSGYTYDSDNVIDHNIIKRLDASDGGTTIEVYLYSLTSTPTCFIIPAIQTNTVDKLKPASIQCIDYYDTTKKAQILYSLPDNLVNCADLPTEPSAPSSVPTPVEPFPIGPGPVKPVPLGPFIKF